MKNAGNSDEGASKKKLVRRYLQFVKPYKYYLYAMLGLGLMQYAVPLATPWLTKILIDDVLVSKQDSGWTLKTVLIIFGSLYAMNIVVTFIKTYIASQMSNKMIAGIRREVYQHLQQMSQKFYDSKHVGGLLSRIVNDVNGAQNLIGTTVINIVFDLIMVIFAAFFLFSLNWKLALLALWILPLYYLMFTNMNVRIRFASRAVNRQMERISGMLVERIGGMKIVQSFNREQTELARFDKQAERHINHSLAAQLLSNLLGRFSEFAGQSGTLLTWGVGGAFVLSGHMTIGSLIAFLAYLGQLYGPIQRFADVNVTIQNSLTNIERIFELLDVEPDVKNADKPLPLAACEGDIRFKNVCFTYETEVPIPRSDQNSHDPDLIERQRPDKSFYWLPQNTNLPPLATTIESRSAIQGVSFHAKPGQVVALVGPSGAGKSTLIHFIPRFYDADRGSIFLDDVNIKDYDLQDLRRQIAIVMQENVLFSGTVYENIVYGRPEATMEEVIEAAKNPKILILDEATSALDAESEAVVTEALDRLMKGRTTFVIAHRLATVVRADLILVLNNGQVAESGTHEQLLLRGGLYRELYEKQLKAMRPEGLELAERSIS
ncbi:MAG: multidrug transporter ATP-binding protein [Paenibacillus sp.]|nr:multidrug transporter ATP-binding protein [Paenibacillus sp.]